MDIFKKNIACQELFHFLKIFEYKNNSEINIVVNLISDFMKKFTVRFRKDEEVVAILIIAFWSFSSGRMDWYGCEIVSRSKWKY